MKTQYWVRKLPATRTRGERVRIKNLTTNVKFTIPYDYQFNNIYEVAREHLRICGEIVDEVNSGWVDAKKQYLITIKRKR